MKLQISDTFDISRDVFVEQVFFDEVFNAALHDHLGFRSRRIVERSGEGGNRRLVIEFESGEKLPWAARKLWGDYVAWTEVLTYDAESYQVQSQMTPRALGRQVSTRTVMHFDAPAPGRCTRRVAIEVEVNVPLVGRGIAAKMAENIRDSFVKTAAFIRDYARRNGLS